MNPRLRRLEADYREVRTRFDADPAVEIQTEGNPPDKYIVVYRVPALRPSNTGQLALVKQTAVVINLGAGYPREKPTAVTIDPVWHPNIGPLDNSVCIADFWVPAQSLADIIHDIGEMLQYRKFNIQSPLNANAADWTQSHASEIPLAGNVDIGVTGVHLVFGRSLEPNAQ